MSSSLTQAILYISQYMTHLCCWTEIVKELVSFSVISSCAAPIIFVSVDQTNNADVRTLMSLPHPLPVWEFGKVINCLRWYGLMQSIFRYFIAIFIIFSYSSFSQYFGSLHQFDLVGSFHFSFPLSLFFFFFLFHLPFLPQQLPSFIILVSISSPFGSSGLIAYFVSYFSHLLSPFPSTLFLLKPFHVVSLFFPCPTKYLIRTSNY